MTSNATWQGEEGDTSSSAGLASRASISAPNNVVVHGGDALNAQSCQFCRRRKIKCDKSSPVCNQCIKANQTCIYAPSQRRGRPRNSSTAVSSQEQSKDVLLKRIRRLESLVEEYKSINSKPAGNSDELSDPLGKLVIGKPYLDDEFWISKELTDAIGYSDDTESEDELLPTASAAATDFLWGVTPIVHDLRAFHPPKHQILQYWQTYVDNCECLLRMVHTPTTSIVITDFLQTDVIDNNDELLLFCFYYAAINSLSDDDVRQQYNQDRGALLSHHELAIKHALTRAQFLHAQDFKVLQALVLYISDATVSSVVWHMVGLAFRIAQGMGIDRDGELFGLPPFETEMRRRLWYQLLFLDLRTAEVRGCLSAFLRYDTRLPTSINEIEMFPEMTEYPKSTAGYTDLTIPLMRWEVARLGRRLQGTGFRDTPLPHAAKKKIIEDFQQQLYSKYVKHCMGKGPLPEYCSKTATMITARTNLVVYQGKMKDASQEEKDWLFLICIEIMEHYDELSRKTVARRWAWLLKIVTQWHAIAFALSELCERHPSPHTERAWRVIDATSGEWSPPPDASGTVIYNSVKKLLSKAQRRREFYARASVATSMSPNFSESPKSQSQSQSGTSTSDFSTASKSPQYDWKNPSQTQSIAAQSLHPSPFPDPSVSMPGGFNQAPATTMPLLDPLQNNNLPDWFFGGPAMQDPNVLNFGADMAWDWTNALQGVPQDRSDYQLGMGTAPAQAEHWPTTYGTYMYADPREAWRGNESNGNS